MEKLKVIAKKDKKIVFESENLESVFNWLITILYDGNIKRAKVKIEQYYEDDKEYCKVVGTYRDNIEDNKYIVYEVTGLRNDWGNFINMQETLIDNNIRIIKGE